MEAKAAPGGTDKRIAEVRARVGGFTRQVETLIRAMSDYERERMRSDFAGRYANNPAGVEKDPEFQIRLREIERENDRRKTDIGALVKLIEQNDHVLAELARREEEALARERTAKEAEGAARNEKAELEKQKKESLAGVEKEATRIRAQAEELLRQTEADAKHRAEAISQAWREVEALQQKMAQELARIDSVLNKAKSEIAGKLSLVFQEMQTSFEQGRKDIQELLQ